MISNPITVITNTGQYKIKQQVSISTSAVQNQLRSCLLHNNTLQLLYNFIKLNLSLSVHYLLCNKNRE